MDFVYRIVLGSGEWTLFLAGREKSEQVRLKEHCWETGYYELMLRKADVFCDFDERFLLVAELGRSETKYIVRRCKCTAILHEEGETWLLRPDADASEEIAITKLSEYPSDFFSAQTEAEAKRVLVNSVKLLLPDDWERELFCSEPGYAELCKVYAPRPSYFQKEEWCSPLLRFPLRREKDQANPDDQSQITKRKHVNVLHYLFPEEHTKSDMAQQLELSSAEAAGLVFHDESLTLSDRRRAFQRIIDRRKDETVRYIDFHKEAVAETSLHKLLRTYMEEQVKLEKLFFADEPETVYMTCLDYMETEERRYINGPALSLDVCIKALQREMQWVEDTGPWKAYVTKYYPKKLVEGIVRELTAVFDETGELLDITTQMPITFPGFCDLLWTMDQLPRERDVFGSERTDRPFDDCQ